MARVLVVDDEEPMVALLTDILRRRGYEVSAARTGQEAAEMLDQEQFDVVVSDIFMPDGTGIDLLAEMRLKGNEVAFIGMSGGHVGLYAPFAKVLSSLGATATLRKPFAAAELLGAVESLLGRQEVAP
jgi:DNA-binding response OmpR family regulator